MLAVTKAFVNAGTFSGMKTKAAICTEEVSHGEDTNWDNSGEANGCDDGWNTRYVC